MANVDEQAEYTTQYWFCGMCKVTEECSMYTTVIYHKHASSLVILQPLTKQAYAELKTVVSKVKKVRKRDAVWARKAIHGLTAQEIDKKYGNIPYTSTPPVDAVSTTYVELDTDSIGKDGCTCFLDSDGTPLIHTLCIRHRHLSHDKQYSSIKYIPDLSNPTAQVTYKATPNDPLAQIPHVVDDVTRDTVAQCLCSIAPGGTQMVHNECPIHGQKRSM